MADINILKSARTVDEIIQEAFRERSRQTKIPKAESINYNAQELFLFYGLNHADGRMIAAKFLDHLVDNNKIYRIARPQELDDPDFDYVAFARMDQAVVNKVAKVAVSSDRKPGTTDLLSYSEGDLQIVDDQGLIQFYFRGALPNTSSVSIRVKMGAEDQSVLYGGFLLKCKKNQKI